MKKTDLRQHWPLLALLVVVILTYAPLWGVGWSWDDEALVVDNQKTHTLENIGTFFTRDLWSTTRLEDMKSGYYRPLMLLSLALDRAVIPEIRSPAAATLAHVHSLLWHLLVVTGLYAVLVRLVPVGGAILGVTVFALHPVNAEVLALIAARNDSMAAAFTLLAIWTVMDRAWDWRRGLGAGVLFLAGMLSKESAVLGPFMLLTLDVARFRTIGDWRRYLPFVLAGGIYLLMRTSADINSGIMPSSYNFQVLWENTLSIVALYSKLLVWPWPLTPARHVHYLPALSESLFGMVVFAGLVVAGLTRGQNRPLVIAGVVWAVLAFLPSLAATLDKGLLGERYLYFALAGLGLSLAAAVPTPPKWLPAVLAIPAIVTLQVRLPQWKDSRSVWEAAHAAAPSPFTAAGLAWYYHRDKDLDQALPLFEMALAGDPPYRDACELITQAHLEAKRPQKAAEIAAWAVNERGCPPQGRIIDHWAVALAGIGEWEQAAQVALKQPGGPRGPSLIVVAAAMAHKGQYDRSLQIARQRAALANPGQNLPIAQQMPDPTFMGRVVKMLRLGNAEATADGLVVALAADLARKGQGQQLQGMLQGNPSPRFRAAVVAALRSTGDDALADQVEGGTQ